MTTDLARRGRIKRRSFLAGAAALGLAAVAGSAILLRREGPRPPGFRLLLAGDIFHGDSYERGGQEVLSRYGYDHAFERLKPLLGRADYVVANLEAAATELRQSPLTGKHFLHRTSTEHAPASLARNGIRAVGLANNHSMDFGPQGLADTFAALHRRRIRAFGAGPDPQEAGKPLVLRVPGAEPRHVGIFAMFEYRPDFEEQHRFYAAAGNPGVARFDAARFRESVRSWRERYENLFVVAFAHWGKNYAWRTPDQAEMGRALVDAGADLVVGHHGHNFQEIERYEGKWILYGIGNFVFNSMGRFTQFGDLPPYGLAVELDFPRGGEGDVLARLYPILVDNRRTNFQPHVVGGDEGRAALSTLLDRSELSLGRWNVDLEADELGPHLVLRI
jgi:hypothetical protein